MMDERGLTNRTVLYIFLIVVVVLLIIFVL